MAGRRVSGAGQLALACSGFGLMVVYFVRVLLASWQAYQGELEPVLPPASGWQWALILFGGAWIWSGVTSVLLWVEWRRLPREPGSPPVLD